MTAAGSPSTSNLTGTSRVGFHSLSLREDGERWIIGRVETGTFIALPHVGKRALELLGQGMRVDEAQECLRVETGVAFDVVSFAAVLLELEFICDVDGLHIEKRAPSSASLAWLRPHHVAWVLHPATAAALVAVWLGATTLLTFEPGLLPGYRDLIWSSYGGVVLAGNAVLGWAIVLAHELGHLITARAYGVPGRVSLGTRLQFLVAQTDVSGIWAAPRRVRVTVYLAGIAVNLTIAAVGLLVLGLTGPTGMARHLLAAVILLSLSSIAPQLLVFMRTDVYFLLQDLTGCVNLYADGIAYLRWQLVRLCGFHREETVDAHAAAIRHLSTRELRIVRRYGLLLFIGTAICLAVAASVTLPATLALTIAALRTLSGSPSVTRLFDALLVLGFIGGFQCLWIRAWWRHHGSRLVLFRMLSNGRR